MRFHIGQKVVCVDDSPNEGYQPPIKKGVIYTIAFVEMFWDGLGVDLVESPSPPATTGWSCYRGDRFRPVVERRTDISVFTEILRRASIKKLARA